MNIYNFFDLIPIRTRSRASADILLVQSKQGMFSSFSLHSCLSYVLLACCIPMFFKICSLASQVLFSSLFLLFCFLFSEMLAPKAEVVTGV